MVANEKKTDRTHFIPPQFRDVDGLKVIENAVEPSKLSKKSRTY